MCEREGTHGGAVALVVGDDLDALILPVADARVGRAEVDADGDSVNLGHGGVLCSAEMGGRVLFLSVVCRDERSALMCTLKAAAAGSKYCRRRDPGASTKTQYKIGRGIVPITFLTEKKVAAEKLGRDRMPS